MILSLFLPLYLSPLSYSKKKKRNQPIAIYIWVMIQIGELHRHDIYGINRNPTTDWIFDDLFGIALGSIIMKSWSHLKVFTF